MATRTISVGLVAGVVGLGCGKPTPSPQDLAEIARLDTVRSTVAAQIRDAAADESLYSRGLLGMLAKARREVLQTTDALILQRAEAMRAGARFTYTASASQPDTARAQQIELEIAKRQSELRDAQRERQRYEGGLLEAMAALREATVKATLASLDQERLAALYGLVTPTVGPYQHHWP